MEVLLPLLLLTKTETLQEERTGCQDLSGALLVQVQLS